jgi:hypothetical protein
MQFEVRRVDDVEMKHDGPEAISGTSSFKVRSTMLNASTVAVRVIGKMGDGLYNKIIN